MFNGAYCTVHLERCPDLPQVLQPAAAARQGGGFAPARLMSQVSLMYKRTILNDSRRPVSPQRSMCLGKGGASGYARRGMALSSQVQPLLVSMRI